MSAPRPRPKRRHLGRKVLAGVAIVLLSIVVLVVAAVSIVLYTDLGTRKAIETFVSWYDGRVPGHVEVGEIEGNLASGVTLHDVRLADAEDRPLAVAHRVELELRPAALLTRTVGLEYLDALGVTIHQWPAPGGWGDLAPADRPPPPPDEPPGPNLPVTIDAPISVAELAVVRHDADTAEPLIERGRLAVDLHASGRDATVALKELSARVGPGDHVVAASTGVVEWSSPDLEIERLSAITDVALVQRLEGRIDTRASAWTIALHAVPLPSALGVHELPPSLVELRGRGTFDAARARIRAVAPGLLDLDVEAGADFGDEGITATALGSGSVVPNAAFDPAAPALPGRRPVAFLGGLRKHGSELAGAAALVSEQLLVTASLHGDVIEAFVLAPGARVDGRVALADDGLRRVEVDAEISSLRRLRAEIDPLLPLDLPEAQGSVTVDAACEARAGAGLACEGEVRGRDLVYDQTRVAELDVRGHATPGADPLRFDAIARAEGVSAGGTTVDDLVIDATGTPEEVDVSVRARRGKDRLEAIATVTPGPDPTIVELERFDARVKGREVATRGPARVALHDGAVDVEGLRMDLAGGRLDVEGRAAWKGRSDLVVTARRIDLGLLEDFAPAVAVDGRLDARIELQGDAGAPELDADIAGRRLALHGEPLGDLWLRAGYEDERAHVDLSWADRGAAARVRAQVPIAVDLRERDVDLKKGRPLTASIDLHALPMARVSEWVAGPPIEGRLDATVKAHGTIRDPLLAASVTTAHLQIDEREVGNLELHATWDGERVDAVARGVGEVVHRLEASASVPLRLDPRRLRIERDESARHRIALVVRGADVGGLLRDDEALAGRIDLDVVAEAQSDELEGTAHALARNLVVRGREVGAAELVATLDPRRLEAHLQLGGTRVRLLEAHASLPIRMEAPLGPYEVRADDELVAWVDLRELDLALLRDLVGDGTLAGEASGEIAIDGTLADPRIGLRVATDHLTARSADLGRARVEGIYEAGEATAELHQTRGWQSVDLKAKAPVTLDLAARDVEWHRDRPHEVDLVVKAVDRDMLQPLLDLPPSVEVALSATMQARGTIDEPRARADVRASLALEDEPPTPLALHVELEPNEQYARLLFGGNGSPGLTVEARTDARIPTLLAGGDALDDVTLVANAETSGLNLRDLAPVLPSVVYEPSGKLLLDARAVGPLRRPALSGEIAIDDGAATIVALDQRFTSIRLRGSLDGPQVLLDELRMRSGSGSVNVEGYMQVGRGQTRGQAVVMASRLPILRPGVPLMRVDGEVDVDLDATGPVTRVDVTLEDGFVDVVGPKLVERPEQIPPDDGVIYVDARGKKARKKEVKKAAEGEPWLPAAMALEVEIVDAVRIRGAQVDMDWDGEIVVRREPGKPPQASGAFVSEGGRVSFLGNDFDITRGEIRLPGEGELDPFIDVVATTETAEADVTLAITGRASRPTLALSSTPALPEDQIFALLVTGETSPEGGAGNEEVAAKAAGLLASFQNPALQQALRDKVGIDRVGVSFGEAVDQPVLVVGKRVTRDIYVETGYHHNAPRGENNAEVRVEYEFKERWSVDTFFGDAAEGGVGLWWTRRFGRTGPEPARRKNAKRRNADQRRDTARRDAAKRTGPAP